MFLEEEVGYMSSEICIRKKKKARKNLKKMQQNISSYFRVL